MFHVLNFRSDRLRTKRTNLGPTNISYCTVLKCSRVQQCCSLILHVILFGGPVAIEGSKHGGVLQRQFQHVCIIGSWKEAYIYLCVCNDRDVVCM